MACCEGEVCNGRNMWGKLFSLYTLFSLSGLPSHWGPKIRHKARPTPAVKTKKTDKPSRQQKRKAAAQQPVEEVNSSIVFFNIFVRHNGILLLYVSKRTVCHAMQLLRRTLTSTNKYSRL